MIYDLEIEVTKDVYDRAQKHGGYMDESDRVKCFSEADLCGYGIYSPIVHRRGDKYICRYSRGSTCD